MTDFQVSTVGDWIVVRAAISIEATIEIRDSLTDECRGMPKLNQELFTEFGDWVFEEIHDAAKTALDKLKNSDSSRSDISDEPSTFEPW